MNKPAISTTDNQPGAWQVTNNKWQVTPIR